MKSYSTAISLSYCHSAWSLTPPFPRGTETLAELSRLMTVTPSTLVYVIDELMRKGLWYGKRKKTETTGSAPFFRSCALRLRFGSATTKLRVQCER
jgi:hypothetical protein